MKKRLPSQKNPRDRLEQHEIKKELLKFAKAEYGSKKPLELRLIQLKPQTSFQKGSVLPNLLIKSLQNTAYVIYLDYGEEVRFYFFTLEGQSMGASTFPKTEKMLLEMHGKGNTLLKLPKPDPRAGLDLESMFIAEEFKKKAQRLSQKYQISFSTPPIAVIHQESMNMGEKILRLGVRSSKEALHFLSSCVKSEVQDMILLRELFLVMQGLASSDETNLLIATIWAIMETERVPGLFQSHLRKNQYSTPIIQKGLEWLDKVFTPFINSSQDDIKNFSKEFNSVVKFFTWIENQLHISTNQFGLLWFMTNGLHFLRKFRQIIDSGSQFSFLIANLFEFYFSKLDLIQKYQITIPDYDKLQLLWIKYCCHSYIIKSDPMIGWAKDPVIPFIKSAQSELKFDIARYGTTIKDSLKSLNLLEFLSILPENATNELKSDILAVIHKIFLSSGLNQSFPTELEVMHGQQKNIEYSAEIKCNWILFDCKFILWSESEAKLQAGFVEPPKITHFDKSLKVQIRLSGIKPGKGKIRLICEYKIPLLLENIVELELAQIHVKVT